MFNKEHDRLIKDVVSVVYCNPCEKHTASCNLTDEDIANYLMPVFFFFFFEKTDLFAGYFFQQNDKDKTISELSYQRSFQNVDMN